MEKGLLISGNTQPNMDGHGILEVFIGSNIG